MPTANQVLGFAATDLAAGVAEVVPADVYTDVFLEALYARRTMEGIVSLTVQDQNGRAGNIVQVPVLPARTAQTGVAEGTALTDNATVVTTAPVTIDKMGDLDIVNREVWEDQDVFTREDFLRNMARALAEAQDQDVYDELEAATPGNTVDLAMAGVLTDLYDKITEAKAAMEKSKAVPTHLIIGPDQEAALLQDSNEGVIFTQIRAENGRILSVAGLETIVTPLANANAATMDLTQAIIIDKSRACAEAWGRRPTLDVDEMTLKDSDQVRLVAWLRWGVDEVDTAGIAHVNNP